jgi:hypothetical protein
VRQWLNDTVDRTDSPDGADPDIFRELRIYQVTHTGQTLSHITIPSAFLREFTISDLGTSHATSGVTSTFVAVPSAIQIAAGGGPSAGPAVPDLDGAFDLRIAGNTYSDATSLRGLRMSIAKLLSPAGEPTVVRRRFEPGGFQFGNILLELRLTSSGFTDLEQWVAEVSAGNPFARDAELNLYRRTGQPDATLSLDGVLPVAFPPFVNGSGTQAARQVLFAVGSFRFQ